MELQFVNLLKERPHLQNPGPCICLPHISNQTWPQAPARVLHLRDGTGPDAHRHLARRRRIRPQQHLPQVLVNLCRGEAVWAGWRAAH